MAKKRKSSARRLQSLRRRIMQAEQLERRDLLAVDPTISVWQNSARPLDVNNDTFVVPHDALYIINQLNNPNHTGVMPARVNPLAPYLDTNGDRYVSPIDVLQVVNELNSKEPGERTYPTIRSAGGEEAGPAGFISQVLMQIPGETGETFELTMNWEAASKSFYELGVFSVADASGAIDGLVPTDELYPHAAFAQPDKQVLFSHHDIARSSNRAAFGGGQWIGVYILQRLSDTADVSKHISVQSNSDGHFEVRWQEAAGSLPPKPQPFEDSVLTGRVRPINLNPQITSTPTPTIGDDSNYIYNVNARDAVDEQLSYELLAAPPGMTIDATAGNIQWPAESNEVGRHFVELIVRDDRGGFKRQAFNLEVVPALLNRPPVIQSEPVRTVEVEEASSIYAEQKVAFSDWASITYLDYWEDAVWELNRNDQEVTQTNTLAPTVLLSDFELSTHRFEGSVNSNYFFRQGYFGLVFGWQNDQEFYLFDWKQSDSPDDARGAAFKGMSVKRFQSSSPLTERDYWQTEVDSAKGETLFRNNLPWDRSEYQLTLVQTEGHVAIQVIANGNVLENIDLEIPDLKPGRVGLYTNYQAPSSFRDFHTKLFGGEQYQYQVEAIDADGDTLTYELLDHPRDMTIDSVTGRITWQPTFQEVGDHRIVVRVQDRSGAYATQEYVLCVHPAQTNTAPQILSTPPTDHDNSDRAIPYRYPVQAFDADADSLTYALVDPPTGMRIDSTTGLIEWPGDDVWSWSISTGGFYDAPRKWRSGSGGIATVKVRVTDSLGGSDEQEYELFTYGATRGTASGYIYEDVNRNGLLDSNFVVGEDPHLVFVVDNSCSMDDPFVGERVGDLNGDDRFDTRFDATLVGIRSLLDRLAADPRQADARISIVDFDDPADMNPVLNGHQYFIGIGDDADGNGVRDFEDVFRILTTGCGGTNYERALENAVEALDAETTESDSRNVLFMTDGVPERSGPWEDDVATLQAMGVNLQGLGIGRGTLTEQLQTVDPGAHEVSYTQELLDLSQGFDITGFDAVEPVLSGWTVYLDENNNAKLDGDEISTISDDRGYYEFTDLAIGQEHRVRTVVPDGWSQWTPHRGNYSTVLWAGLRETAFNFGNIQHEQEIGNQSPHYVSSPPAPIVNGETLRYEATALDPESELVTYQLVLGPSNASVHPTEGILQWKPNEQDFGSHNFILKATDVKGASVNQSFGIAVERPNTAPLVTSQAPKIWPVGQQTSYRLRAQDAEQDSLSYRLVDAPANMQISPSGEIQWTPDNTPEGLMISDGAIGYWRFNETDGAIVARDETGNELHADVPENTPRTQGRSGSENDSALDLNNWRSGIEHTGTAETQTGQFSMEGWIKPSAGGLGWILDNHYDQDSVGIGLSYAGSRIRFGVNRAHTSYELELDVWSHVVGTFDGERFALYVNGNLVGEETFIRPYIPSENDFVTRGEGVAVDDVALFDYPLTPEQVYSHYLSSIQEPRAVRVAVTDEHGASSIHTFDIYTSAQHQNEPPVLQSGLPSRATVGTQLVHWVKAFDDTGDQLKYRLSQAPAGMTIDAEGVLRWTPAPDQVGQHAVTVEVIDSNGENSTQTGEIVVGTQVENSAPKIQSLAPGSTVAGAVFAYDAQAVDAGEAPLLWTLLESPTGASVDAWTGQLRWTPTHAQLGVQDFVLSVQDTFGARDEQSFSVSVACFNMQPQIVSIPSTIARTGEDYRYAVEATDAESDPLTWTLVEAPDGMKIDASGVISWVPSAEQIGTNSVEISVTDGISTQLQAFEIEVLAPLASNRAPIISSEPNYHARTGSHYTYQLQVVDPDGDDLTLAVDGAMPYGMQFDTSGLVSWTPTLDQAGLHVVHLVATDSQGLAATQVFTLAVEENLPPQFTSTPPVAIEAGAEYEHLLKAYDPEGGQVHFALAGGPSGMQIDALGRISWTAGTADAEPASVTATATDEFGLQASLTWQIESLTDSVAPNAALTVVTGNRNLTDDAVLDIGSTFTVRVSGNDNVGIAAYQLSVDGAVIGLDEQGFATLRADTTGDLQLVGTVTDVNGLTDSASLVIRVEDPTIRNAPIPTDPTLPPNPGPDPADLGVPFIEITSPEGAATVSNLVPIVGTVDDPEDNLWFYRVYYARADRVDLTELDMDDPDWTIIETKTQEVHDGQLAVLDTSRLSNDPYTIAVAAYDVNGLGYIQPTQVYVEGKIDVGNFTFSVPDLSIPLAGIPIQVTRTYNTRNALDDGDFGFGWTLAISDPRIFEATAIGSGGAMNPGNDKFVPGRTKVYLNNPDGDRVGFTYNERYVIGGLFGAVFEPYFVPDPGVYDQLLLDETQVFRGQIAGDFGRGINPDTYTLVSKSGISYRYSDQAGLELIEDENGNTVEVSTSGMRHSSGQTIRFIRDANGRIESIIDPAGNEIHYDYDGNGDLRKVTDQIGLETTYSYRTDIPHYLDEAANSLGNRVFEVQYDQDGKHVGVVDALGNLAEQDFETEANRGVVRDVLGNATTLIYDDRGNVLREIDAAGNETLRTYADVQNPDLETEIVNRNGNVSKRTYDERGNVLSVTEFGSDESPLTPPIATSFAYDAGNNVQAITNAAGHTTTFHYDAFGQITRITNALGDSSSFTYDDQGRRVSFTDFVGNVTTFEYDDACACGSPSRVNFADVTYQTSRYNDFGQVTETAYYEADGTLVEIKQTDYDEVGRPVEERQGLPGDPSHPQTMVRKFYRGHLLDWEVVVHPESLDADGNLLESPETPVAERKSRITDYEYDAADRVIRQTDAEGGVVEFRYDAAGNRILLQDPVGNITTWVYDSLQRVSEERDPFYNAGKSIEESVSSLSIPSGADLAANVGADHVRVYGYDGEGNQVETIDRNGRRREFEYDYAGRLQSERWFAAATDELVETVSFTYDILGNTLVASDSNSKYLYSYDALNRLTSVDNNPNDALDIPRVILSYGYDAQGNVIRTQDDAGVTVESKYDARNRLSDRSWFDAHVSDGETAEVDPLHVEFDYTAAGRESEVRRYSGLTNDNLVGRTVRTYDSVGRSDLLNHLSATDELLAGYDYDYDFGSLLTHESRSHQNAEYAQEVDYGYDLTGQLVDALFTGQEDEHFTYDANGNRITSSLGDEHRSYTTGLANQLTSDGEYRYEYDGEGNQTKRVHLTTGETRLIQYNHRNRITRVDDHANASRLVAEQSVEYQYNAFSQRVAKNVALSVNGEPGEIVRQTFVSDGTHIWRLSSQEADTVRYLHGSQIDQILASYGDVTESHWMLTDRIGSVVTTFGSDGNLKSSVKYSAFGEPRHPPQDALLFAGRAWEKAVEMYYNRARFFSPRLGRFNGNDPRGLNAGDANFYRYVGNSPTNGTDPSGEVAITFAAGLISTTTRQQGAALIGFLHGFGLTNISFIGEILNAANTGGINHPDAFRIAIANTILKMHSIQDPTTFSAGPISVQPPVPGMGAASSFFGGVGGFQFSAKVSLIEGLLDLDIDLVPPNPWIRAALQQVNHGGFYAGRTVAIARLTAMLGI